MHKFKIMLCMTNVHHGLTDYYYYKHTLNMKRNDIMNPNTYIYIYIYIADECRGKTSFEPSAQDAWYPGDGAMCAEMADVLTSAPYPCLSPGSTLRQTIRTIIIHT